MKLKPKEVLVLTGFIIVAQLAGIIGSVFTIKSIPTWYSGLIKPVFNPPNWLFGPVWLILYLLMAISAFLIWQKGWKRKEVKFALSVFGVQLILNALWSILFFGLKQLFFAFVEIIILWAAILATIILFYKLSKRAGYLLVPYILWVSFAAILNFSVFLLN